MPHSFRNRILKANRLAEKIEYGEWVLDQEPWRWDLLPSSSLAGIHILRSIRDHYEEANQFLREAVAIKGRLTF